MNALRYVVAVTFTTVLGTALVFGQGTGPNGAIARCGSGEVVYVDSGNLTCSGHGGVKEWFRSRTTVVRTGGPNGAIARCGNGSVVYVSSGAQTCARHGGVVEWFSGANAEATTQSSPVTSKPSTKIEKPQPPPRRTPTIMSPPQWTVFEETNLEGSISGTVTQGRVFKTTSGNIYEVTGLTLQLVLELQPEVLVLRSGETYRLIVEGFEEPLICRKLTPDSGTTATADVIESKIDGDFEGWDGDTIFKLQNGQIWQQSSYHYIYRYRFSPKVLIYKSGSSYHLRVDGIERTIQVRRLQ
jgi:hypothetical protein